MLAHKLSNIFPVEKNSLIIFTWACGPLLAHGKTRHITEHGQLQFQLPSCPQKQYPQSIGVLRLPENFTPSFNPKEVYSIPRSAATA
jgi:hypothetical protein